MALDDILARSLGCGIFQVLTVTATYSTQLCASWGMLLMVFGSYHSDWWCDRQLNGHSVSSGNNTVVSFLSPAHTSNQSSASENSFSFETNHGAADNDTDRLLGSCDVFSSCRNVVFDGESSTIVTEWGLICDHAWVESVIISVQMAGVLLGAFLGGYAGDIFGRKISLYGSVALHGVANAIAIVSVSWEMFAAVRFVIGLCIGGILVTCFTYSAEFLNEKWRGVLGSLPVWNIGAATFSVLVYFVRHWRYLHIATALFSALLFIPVFWVPESLRWLAVQGKANQAMRVAIRASQMNRRPPLDAAILEDIAREVRKNITQNGERHQYSLLDLFRGRLVRKVTIVMSVIWVFLAIIYYALSFGIKTFSGDFYTNFIIFCVAELPGMIFVAPISIKLGRRLGSTVYLVFIASACLAVVVVNFAAPEHIKGTVITILALLAKMHILAGWAIVIVFSSELYPTVIRNISAGYLNACARLGAIVAPYVIPMSPDLLYVYYLIMGVILLGCCLLLMSLPDTKGKPLEDTLKTQTSLSTSEEEKL